MSQSGSCLAEDEQTDDDSLRELFEPFGNITSVCAMKARCVMLALGLNSLS